MDEAITKCIENNIENFKEDVQIVSLQELLAGYEIFDEVNDAGTDINWVKGSNHISNTDYYLLNRVLQVPRALFTNFIEVDQEYARREFEAYIGFSFNAFHGIGNHLASGACVDSVSLPRQWNIIVKEFDINVPNYYWGLSAYNHLSDKDNLVYSTIFNFLNWSVNSNPMEENHIFCFEKPEGHPVFILTIGEVQLITADISLSNELKDKLKYLAGRISQFFNHFISEILIFIEGEDLIFGCINPEIIRSNKHQDFEHFVCTHLVSEFYKCIN